MITKSDVDAAVARVGDRVRVTPVLRVEAELFGAEVVLKCEYTQHTGSFKARGAFNRILAAAEDAGPGVGGRAGAGSWPGDGDREPGTGLNSGPGGTEREPGPNIGSGTDGNRLPLAASANSEPDGNGRERDTIPARIGDGEHAPGDSGRGTHSGPARVGDSGHGLDAAGVVAASGGNAGLAVAYAASQLGVPATVFVPTAAPRVKVDKLHALGATVRQIGREFAVANAAALEHAADSGALFCHAYDQPEIVAGQGGLAVELMAQAPDVDTVVVSVGGGGLLGGIAAGLAGAARLVAVEPVTIPTLHDALAAGRPVDVEVSGVAADSLGARRIGGLAFELAVAHGVHSVLVDDAAIVAARRLLWDRLRIVVEHGTAAALAALLSGAYRPEPGERVAVVLCGANTDPNDLA